MMRGGRSGWRRSSCSKLRQSSGFPRVRRQPAVDEPPHPVPEHAAGLAPPRLLPVSVIRIPCAGLASSPEGPAPIAPGPLCRRTRSQPPITTRDVLISSFSSAVGGQKPDAVVSLTSGISRGAHNHARRRLHAMLGSASSQLVRWNKQSSTGHPRPNAVCTVVDGP